MKIRFCNSWAICLIAVIGSSPFKLFAQEQSQAITPAFNQTGMLVLAILILLVSIVASLFLLFKAKKMVGKIRDKKM